MKITRLICIVLIVLFATGCNLQAKPDSEQISNPIVTTPEEPSKPVRNVLHQDVLRTPYQLYEDTAVYQDKIYISIGKVNDSYESHLEQGIYEVDLKTQQYQLLVPIKDEFWSRNIAVYQDKLFYVQEETLYQVDVKTKESSVFTMKVKEVIGVKNNNLLYYTSELYPPKPTDPIGAGNSYLVQLMMHNFETNKTTNLGEHNINYLQRYVFAYDDFLYIALHSDAEERPSVLQVAYDTHQIKKINTNNKYLNIIYQYDNATYFADHYNHSVRALDKDGLRVFAREVTLGDKGVATEDGIYYFTYQQGLYSHLELLRYDGTKEVITDLYNLAGDVEQVYLYDDYLYYLGDKHFDGVGRAKNAIFRFDLHDHSISRVDQSNADYVSTYRIVKDYIIYADNDIRIMAIRE